MKFFFHIITFLFFASCSTDSVPVENVSVPLPDRTPFIMGLLEATYDTVHHHPELVAGYVNNVEGFFNQNSLDTIPVYNPTLWSQVVKTSKRFHLTFTPDNEAEVIVTGPLDHPEEKSVVYSHIEEGVFGDINHQLYIIPNENYRLDVTFNDGRVYRTITKIPEETTIDVPDSLGIQVDYTPYHDGSAMESSLDSSNFYIPVAPPKETFLTLVQSNSNRDREQLLLEPEEEFLFHDRGHYLRDGAMYHISMTGSMEDSLRRQWGQDLYDKKKEDVRHSQYFWMTFSFFNEDIGYIFHPMVDLFSSKGEEFEKMMSEFVEHYEARNPSYLLDVSTIQKVDEEGNVLPQDETDAIGFFAGYFSVYRTTTMYPLRTFDLDEVLENNRVYNPDGNN